MIPAQYIPNQPNAHNNRSSGVSLRAQLLRHKYFGILATVQGGLHSAVGVLRGPRDGFRTKQRRQLSFQEAVVVFFEPRVLGQLLFNGRIVLRLSFRGRHRTVAIADILRVDVHQLFRRNDFEVSSFVLSAYPGGANRVG